MCRCGKAKNLTASGWKYIIFNTRKVLVAPLYMTSIYIRFNMLNKNEIINNNHEIH